MIEATIIMNSSVEEILAFKCCNLPDQNLEVHLYNTGGDSVVVKGFFQLENDTETVRVHNLFPNGNITVPPYEITALYCYMDNEEWKRFHTITFFDVEGNAYSFPTRSTDNLSP